MQKKGGSFYAIALGIGILISTITSLVTSAVETARPQNAGTHTSRKSNAIIRLSPVPSRSAISLWQ